MQGFLRTWGPATGLLGLRVIWHLGTLPVFVHFWSWCWL